MKAVANNFLILIKRELWENKGSALYLPIAIAVFILALHIFGIVVSAIYSSAMPYADSGFDRFEAGQAMGLAFMTLVIWWVAFFVATIYAIGALFSDRKDRSILFWKSMPISESMSVATKLFFAAVLIPTVALLVSIVLMFFSSLLMAISISQLSDAGWWSAWLSTGFFSVTAFFIVFSLVFYFTSIPWFSWFLFCSALAKKSPGIIAFLIPTVIVLVEALIFSSGHSLQFIFDASAFYYFEALHVFDDTGVAGPIFRTGDYVQFIPSAAQVVKMVVLTALCLPAAVWLRNSRFEI